MKISPARAGDSVSDRCEEVFAFYAKTIVSDPSSPHGEAEIRTGRGQQLHFKKTYPQATTLRVSGFINTKIGEGGTLEWSASGQSYRPLASFVEIFGGVVNGEPITIEGKKLQKESYKKDIDAELFAQPSPIGVALYVKANEADIKNGTRKYEIKFHSLSRLNSSTIKRMQKAGVTTKSYDAKWLWNGTTDRASARGVIRANAPEAKKWTGKETIGRLLLAIITPPPVRFIQVVHRNINHGIYCTGFGFHKHTFWG
jgi:hypothetical protein